MTKYFSILLLLFVLSCTSKKEQTAESNSIKPMIAVVNYPLYYFAKTIGGDHVTVYLPSIGGDPSYWKPDSKQVNNFQNADLILVNGAGYAKWVDKVSLPSSKIVNTSIAFKDQWIEVQEGVAHSHGAEGEHVHYGIAFTTWLNFDFASKQAESVFNAINSLLPKHSEELSKNFEKLKRDLSDLDSKMKQIAVAIGERQVIASHPVYQYMEEGYNIKIYSEHWEPDEMPSEEQWEAFKKTIKDHNASVTIWEDKPLEKIVTKLDELNVSGVVFSPCANAPESGDFMTVMHENLNLLEQSIKK